MYTCMRIHARTPRRTRAGLTIITLRAPLANSLPVFFTTPSARFSNTAAPRRRRPKSKLTAAVRASCPLCSIVLVLL